VARSAKYVFLIESYHAVTAFLQVSRTHVVIFNPFCVDRPVKLNDQLLLGTKEIHDKRTDWMLASKLETLLFVVSNLGPQQRFSIRGFPSHFTRTMTDDD
jgi:hypothetical protein